VLGEWDVERKRFRYSSRSFGNSFGFVSLALGWRIVVRLRV
jgi:hypothetical protein